VASSRVGAPRLSRTLFSCAQTRIFTHFVTNATRSLGRYARHWQLPAHWAHTTRLRALAGSEKLRRVAPGQGDARRAGGGQTLARRCTRCFWDLGLRRSDMAPSWSAPGLRGAALLGIAACGAEPLRAPFVLAAMALAIAHYFEPCLTLPSGISQRLHVQDCRQTRPVAPTECRPPATP